MSTLYLKPSTNATRDEGGWQQHSHDWIAPAVLAIGVVALHLACIRQYGIFRDELYYVACSKRLAWGYVDQPPLSIFILRLTRLLFGDSVIAIRLPVILAGGLTVFLVGLIVIEMGGGRFAQVLACSAAALATVYLAVAHFFSMNAFDILLWTLALFVFTRILKEARLSLWIALGVVLGLGLLNKWSVLWLIAGLFVGLALTPHRKLLLTPGPWIAGAIAFAFLLPQLLWQMQNGWPTPEFVHNATGKKMNPVPASEFVLMQFLVMNPGSAPIWLIGLGYGLFAHEGRKWRPLCLAFLTVVAILLINGKSRVNYLSPAYPPLLALGGIAIEGVLQKRAALGRWISGGLAFALLLLGGLVTLPFALPILPVPTFVRYARAIGIGLPPAEHGKPSLLPQNYADMFGWETLAATVAQVYHGLPPEERAQCAIYASNYGEAGAIDYWAQKYGLPEAISGHNNYWLWGPRGWNGKVVILINADLEEARQYFKSVEKVGELHSPYAMPFEQDAPICVARGLKIPVRQLWPKLKKFI